MDSGLTINEIKEILIQTYAYCGFPRSVNALNTFIETLKIRKANGINDPIGPESTPIEQSNNISFGADNQRRLFGREARGEFLTFSPEIDRFLKSHLFGDIYGRDLLD